MSSFRGSIIILMVAVGLSAPALAQPKGDAGSGPTKGAVSTDDAGSGPTKGAKPNSDPTAASDSNGSTENSAGVTLALNQLEARSLSRRRRPKRSSSLCHKQGVYLYTLVMNSDPQKLQPCRDGQGCVERRR